MITIKLEHYEVQQLLLDYVVKKLYSRRKAGNCDMFFVDRKGDRVYSSWECAIELEFDLLKEKQKKGEK